MTRTNPAVSTWATNHYRSTKLLPNFESWDAYKKKIEFHVGPSGFSLVTFENCKT